MSDKLKNILKYLISAALMVLLLYVSFRNVKWADFMSALKACKWGYVLLSMLIGALAFWLRGIRWRMLLRPIDPSISKGSCFHGVNISNVANMVLPRVGELLRCGYITKVSRPGEDGRKLASYDKVLGTVVLERSWDVLSLLTVLTVTILCTWKRFGSFFRDNVLGQIMGSLSVSWLLVIIALAGIIGLAIVFALRQRNRIFGKIWNFIAGIGKGIVSCLHMERGWMFLVLTVGIWTCYLFMAASIMWSLQGVNLTTEGTEIIDSMNLIDALFLMVVGSISSLVPVPGGFGAYHYLLSLAMKSVYGIPMAAGIVFATLSHESQVLNQIICCAISYFTEIFRKTNNN